MCYLSLVSALPFMRTMDSSALFSRSRLLVEALPELKVFRDSRKLVLPGTDLGVFN